MIRVKIFDSEAEYQSDDIPKWWLNFANTAGADEFTTIDEVNTELMNWSASFWISENKEQSLLFGDRYLDFYDERAYTWFIMRWS